MVETAMAVTGIVVGVVVFAIGAYHVGKIDGARDD